MIGLSHYLTVAAILFTLGVLGIFINRKKHHRDPDVGRADPALGQHQPRGLLDPAQRHHRTGLRPVRADRRGGESAIGLAILVVFFRNRGSIAVEDVSMMKG